MTACGIFAPRSMKDPLSSEAIRAAVVDDRKDDRQRFVSWLNDAPGLSCVATCRSAEEALERLPHCRPDIVLMDIQMPGLSGVECVRRLIALLPESQVMMLTVVEDHDVIFRSLAAGATGYLLKRATAPELIEAVRELHAGGAPMSGQVARQVVAAFREPHGRTLPATALLSGAEQNVLQQLARGLLYKEVANRLGMSLSTVRTHVWQIYRKLQVHNRTEAMLKANEAGALAASVHSPLPGRSMLRTPSTRNSSAA